MKKLTTTILLLTISYFSYGQMPKEVKLKNTKTYIKEPVYDSSFVVKEDTLNGKYIGEVRIIKNDLYLFSINGTWIKVNELQSADDLIVTSFQPPRVFIDTSALLKDGWKLPEIYPTTKEGLLNLSDYLFKEFDLYQKMSDYYIGISDFESVKRIAKKMLEIIEQQQRVFNLLKQLD